MNSLFLIFWAIFFLVGFILLIATIWAIIKSNASTKWPTTDGVITISNIHKSRSTGSSTTSSSTSTTHYKSDIEFTYSVKGNSYKSTRLYFGVKLITMGGYSKSKRLTRKYPVDKQVKVYYNPAKEKEAVVEPGFHGELVLGIIVSIVFMSISIFIMTFGSVFDFF